MAVEGGRPSLRVEVLGPLRLVVGGAPVDVPGPKRRAVLALLALAQGRIVTVDRLLDALWPAQLPESGRQALHNHVSRLRGHLGPAADRLETRHDGYRLALGRDELDVAQARASLATARTAAGTDPAAAFALLEEAYGLWRGPVLPDLVDIEPIAAMVEEFAQLRREVTDALIDSAVAAGRAATILGLAAASAAADPLREPAVLLRMRALAATGQAPEALRIGREYRRRLVEETGLDPTSGLNDLERDILRGAAGPPSSESAEAAQAMAPANTLAPAQAVGAANVAGPATRLIGREALIARLRRLLAAERLVTIAGPGGVGKTRVALEIARQSDGHDRIAAVLPLAPVTDPAAIPHALAAALNLRVEQGDVLSACIALLGDDPGLLVIDNCEHLLDGVRDMAEAILSSCPGVHLLTTSREPLGLTPEYVSRLAPLPLPSPDEDLAEAPSVALFLDRARRVRPGPPPTPDELRTVAEIVRRLDGMPLAIELAAGRLSAFSLADLRVRLDRSLDLLGGGRPSQDSRHRTLRATIEWSYQLLTEDERRLFRHLSVFPDGVDPGTAEQVAADLGLESDPGSVLARLVDASMLDASFEGATRYRMLETLRAYGLDRLAAAGEDKDATRRLLRWAVELTSWIEDAMACEREPEADAVLRRELPNLRTAWRLARSRGSVDDAAAMIIALYQSVAYRDLIELRDWAEELAGDPAIAAHPRAAAVLGTAAEAVYHRGDYRRADRLARAGLERATGGVESWYCLSPLSVAALARGAYADVVEHSLAAAAAGGPHRENLGIAALATAYAGDLDEARRLNERSMAGAVSPSLRSWAAYVAGEIESLAGHSESAEGHYESAIDLARGAGATFLVAVATVGLLSVRSSAGRVHEALGGYRDVIDYFARGGNWTHLWTTLRNLADLLRRLGDEEPAALIDAAADQAPDAPAVEGASATGGPAPGAGPKRAIPSRVAVLDIARQAIERNLTRS